MPLRRYILIAIQCSITCCLCSYTLAQQAFNLLPAGNDSAVQVLVQQQLGKYQPDSLLQQQWKNITTLNIPPADSIARTLLTRFKPALPKLKFNPFITTGSGQLQYGLLYNSRVDSPYAENGILQHQLQFSMQFTIAKALPINIYATVRKSNSAFFRDIYELRADIDLDAMKQLATTQWLNELGKSIAGTGIETANGYLRQYKKLLAQTGQWTQQESLKQQYRDYLAITANPALVTDTLLKDPALKKLQEEKLQQARQFVEHYRQADSLYHHYRAKADSLEQRLRQYRQTAEQYQLLLRRISNSTINPGELEAFAAEHGFSRSEISGKLSGLLAQNRLSLGRSIATPSALITNNTRINGIRYEHTGRYYFALNAGLVDFAVRDYITTKQKNSPPEYIIMAKWGIGRVQKNHFFLTWFAGKKRDYSGLRNADGSIKTLPVSGVGAGGRLNIINPSSYITWEAGQALKSLPVNQSAAVQPVKSGLTGRASKSVAASLRINLPAQGALLEGWYKYFGAGYQSFAGNRVIGNQNQWGVRISQKLFKQRLKLEAAVKTYEFSNRFNLADINAQTVVKSFSLNFRQRKLPSVYIGYLPLSQVVKNGNSFRENAYQVLNMTVSHQYKIGIRRTAAALALTRFFNQPGDSSFSFYNSTSLYYQQQIYFLMYTGNFGINYNQNGLAKWTILEGGATVPLGERFSFSLNGKVISINNQEVKTGWNCSGFARIFSGDYIQAAYQKNFIPVSGNQFTTASFFSLQFYKTFK